MGGDTQLGYWTGMKGVTDPAWSLREAVDEASAWYEPGSKVTGAARTAAIEAWASVVGRRRATRELAAAISEAGSLSAAARSLGMALPTLRRLQESFAAMPDKGEPSGLTLTFDTRLHPFDPAAFTLLVAEVVGSGSDVTVVER